MVLTHRRAGFLTTSPQNTELYRFYLGNPKDAAPDEAPARLDRLLRRECHADQVEAELQGLSGEQVDFLKFGLAYHISRRAGAVRLSNKARVKIALAATADKEEGD